MRCTPIRPVGTSREPAGGRRWHSPVLAALALAVLFTAAFAEFTAHNTFPYWYHWDERGKATQILREKYNLHHLLLLLHAARAVHALRGGGGGLQELVESGRTASALFAALGVALLAIAGWRLFGPPARHTPLCWRSPRLCC